MSSVFRVLLGLSLFTEILCNEHDVVPHKRDDDNMFYPILEYDVGVFTSWKFGQRFKRRTDVLIQPRQPLVQIPCSQNNRVENYGWEAKNDFTSELLNDFTVDLKEHFDWELRIQQLTDSLGLYATNDVKSKKRLLYFIICYDRSSVVAVSKFRSQNSPCPDRSFHKLHKIVYDPKKIDVKFPLMRGKKWVNIKMKGKKEGFRLYYDSRASLQFKYSMELEKESTPWRTVNRDISIPMISGVYIDNSETHKMIRNVKFECRAKEGGEPLLFFRNYIGQLEPKIQLCPLTNGKFKLKEFSRLHPDLKVFDNCIGVVDVEWQHDNATEFRIPCFVGLNEKKINIRFDL